MNNHGRTESKREVLIAKSFVKKNLSISPVIITEPLNKLNKIAHHIARVKPNGRLGGTGCNNKKFYIYDLKLITNNENDNYIGFQSLTRTYKKPQLPGKIFNLYGKQWRVM